jgi:Zn ribbon nucleic-acid-binding protein
MPDAADLTGFTCPQCRGHRLAVYRTRRPCPGRVVRYRECSACGYREVGKESKSHVLPKRKAPRRQS